MINRLHIVIVTGLLLLGCNESKLRGTGGSEEVAETPSSVSAASASVDPCIAGPVKTYESEIYFGSTWDNPGVDWGTPAWAGGTRIYTRCEMNPGNLAGEVNCQLKARTEQVATVNMPSDFGYACSFGISADDARWSYDDYAFLTTGDNRVIWSNGHTDRHLTEEGGLQRQGGLVVFNWERLRDSGYCGYDRPVYACADGLDCSAVDRKVEGTSYHTFDKIDIRSRPEFMQSLGNEFRSATRHDFKLIITANNTDVHDCSHTGFRLKTVFEYVPKG